MLKKKYVGLFTFLLVIFTICSAMAFNTGGEDMKEGGKDYTSIRVYYPHNFQFDKLVNKVSDATEIQKWSHLEVIPQLNDTGNLIEAYANGATISVKNLEILFDQQYLRQYLNERLRVDVDNFWIANISSFIDGYIVIIEHNNILSFMPVLSEYKTYGGFTDKTIYTWDEFSKLCEPQNCDLIIDNAVIECDQPPIMQYGYTKVPLRTLLENLGFVVDWNSETENIIFSKDNIVYSYVANKDTNPSGRILKNGESQYNGSYSNINGRTMVDSLFLLFLERELNIDIVCDTNNHIVTINNKQINYDSN